MSTQTVLTDVKGIIDKRYEALFKDLDTYIASWGAVSVADKQPLKILAVVADEMKRFLTQRKAEIENISHTSSLKQQHLRNTIANAYLDEAVRDWQDIKRAGEQRAFYVSRGDEKPLATLKTADELGRLCLERANIKGVVDSARVSTSSNILFTPICYFDRNVSMIKAPYTDLPIVAAPSTAVNLSTDLFAVIHEIGHYVFEYLNPTIATTIENLVAERDQSGKPKFDTPYRSGQKFEDKKITNWVEEMFSDLFAQLIGGSEYDKQFRGFLLSRTPFLENVSLSNGETLDFNGFLVDDVDHAPALLRPELLNDTEWSTILSDLSVKEDQLSSQEDKDQFKALQNNAKTKARELSQKIGLEITSVSGPAPIPIPTQVGTVNYVYKNKGEKTFAANSGIEQFVEELKEWDQEKGWTIGWGW